MTDKYYVEIKNKLIDNEVYKKVKEYSINRHDLSTYYDVGKLLIEAQGGEERAKYGNQLIKKYSIKLTKELGKGYSEMNLKYMRKFYLFQKRHAVHVQLSWNHYKELMRILNIDIINYYITISVQQNLSVRQLRERIKQKEYERLPESTKLKLINKEETEITGLVKDPIVIKNSSNK